MWMHGLALMLVLEVLVQLFGIVASLLYLIHLLLKLERFGVD
jgi:hypothetical protein